MGLCERTAGWSWQGYTGTFMPSLGVVLLLLLSLVQSASANADCPPAVVPQNISQPRYQNITGGDAAGFITAFVRSFLDTVQPNPFPEDLILRLIKTVDQQQIQELITKTLLYHIGFLVCVAIGILYIVLMPIVGLFLACCRCCGNCGGKMYQKQTPSTNCRRRTFYWSLFVTTIIILIGNISMFQSNETLKANSQQTLIELNSTINNIRTFVTAVPQQFNHVVDESSRTIQKVEENLDAIGSQLGTEIQNRLRSEALDSALTPVSNLNDDVMKSSVELKSLNSSLSRLQVSLVLHQANITAVRDRIDKTLSDANCVNCSWLRPELQKLTLDTTISSPSLKEFQDALDQVISMNLTSKLKDVEDYLDSIPGTVTNDTASVVQDSKKLLGDLRGEIAQVADDLPLSVFSDILTTLDQVHVEILRFTPGLELSEYIRWLSFLTLSCVVLLVVLCNLLGLVLGPLGLRPKSDPVKRSCTAECGGIFFMIGAGFSFLFSWLFMIVVVGFFLLGGSVYTMVCKPWDNGQLLQFVDVIPGVEIGPSLGLKDNLTVTEIYTGCIEEKPLWTTLRLHEVIDLDELLNVTKYTDVIEENFENSNITLSSITILSGEEERRLRSFADAIKDIDFSDITQRVANLSSINLNTTAGKLDSLAGLQTNAAVKEELRNEARDLRRIQADMETTVTPQLESISSAVAGLRSNVEKMNKTVGEVLRNVAAAQNILNTNTTLIVKSESRSFLDCQTSYVSRYADWANLTITQQVGQCGPVAGTVDSAVDLFCSQAVDSLNQFWFGLGWCLIFFIPSIILSIKLAKYYRKMKYSDFYDDAMYMHQMHQIPRAQTHFR